MYVLKKMYFRGSLETRRNICPLIIKIWPLKLSCFSQHQILSRIWNICLWQICWLWVRLQSLIRVQRLARMTTQTQLKLLSLRFTTVLANKKIKDIQDENVCVGNSSWCFPSAFLRLGWSSLLNDISHLEWKIK